MNTFHMKYFVDAVRAGSLQRAAEANFITHSAVSLAIRALEKELGADLLVHEKRKFILTPEGEKAKTRFELWLRDLEELKVDLTANSETPSGDLRLVGAQSLISTSVSEALIGFRKKYPGIKVQLTAATAAGTHSAVLSGDADLGILVDHHRLTGCDSALISKGRFVLVKRPSSKRRLEDGVMVTAGSKVEVEHLARGIRKRSKQKQDLKIDMEVMSWTLMKYFVLKTDSIGYVPDYMVREELASKKLVLLPAPFGLFDYEAKAAWNQGRALHRNAKLFLEALLGR